MTPNQQVLSDEQVSAAWTVGTDGDAYIDPLLMRFARAIESATLAALAQQAQEPVAWLYVDTVGERYLCFSRPTGGGTITNLYTTPPAPQPAPVDERIEEAFPPPTPIDSEELDAWVCDHCNGGGWHWQEHQVGERKTDVQQLKTHCDKCEGLGYCGPDAEARAALQSTAPQTKGQP